jgi:hypothetical protein
MKSQNLTKLSNVREKHFAELCEVELDTVIGGPATDGSKKVAGAGKQSILGYADDFRQYSSGHLMELL